MTDPRRLLEGDGEAMERQLLDSARGDAPSEGRRQALMAHLGLALPPLDAAPRGVEELGMGPPVGDGGATAAVTAQLSATKLVLMALGVGALATLGVVAFRSSDPASLPAAPALVAGTSAQLAVPPKPQAPEAHMPPPLAPTPALSAESQASPVEGATQGARRRATASQARDDLANELALIDSARADLANNRARGALQKLDDYAGRYPRGRLGSEARLLRIQSLLALGERDAAVRLGKAALDRSPNGPYARRIRSLIGEPETAR